MQSSSPQKIKILVEILHGLGDTVCALPMLYTIRQSYPNAEITVLTKTLQGKQILQSSRIRIDYIYCLDVYSNIFNTICVFRKLRNMQFTYSISSSITPVFKARLFNQIIHPFHWSGIQKRGIYFNDIENKYHFISANLLGISDICPYVDDCIQPILYPDPNIVRRMKKRIYYVAHEKVLGICIGNGDFTYKCKFLRIGKVYTRGWGIDNIVSVIKLLQNYKIKILLFGGKQEIPLMNYAQKYIDKCENVISLVGKTTIQESIALSSLCQCVVGVDTGMQHIASAVGTKTISIFGPTNPDTHGPNSFNSYFVVSHKQCPYQYCYGTKRYVTCKNRKCIFTISPREITNRIVKILFF